MVGEGIADDIGGNGVGDVGHGGAAAEEARAEVGAVAAEGCGAEELLAAAEELSGHHLGRRRWFSRRRSTRSAVSTTGGSRLRRRRRCGRRSSGSGAASGVCDSSEVLVPAEEREARPRPIGCEFDGKGAGVEEVAEPEVDQAQPPLRAVHARIATH